MTVHSIIHYEYMKNSKRSNERLLSLLLLLLLLAVPAWAQNFPRTTNVLEQNKDLLPEAVVTIGTRQGRLWESIIGNDGDSITMDSLYMSASSIKWVSSVVILRLVHEGAMHLKDSPSQYLDYSTTRTTELDSVTVEMLLSFTSGFRGTSLTVPCSSDGDTTIAACAQEIAETLFTFAPNTTFFYGPAHFQILAAMAQNATGQSWQAIFESRVGQVLGMASTEYITPSRSNPRVSGGAIVSANDMDAFLRAMLIQDPNFLSPDLWNIMLQDHTQSDSIRMLYTPIQAYPFHYGLGVWRECTARITKTFDSSCEPITIVSVTGATGVHGWVDYNNSYYGLIMADLGLSGGSKVLGFSVESLRKNVLADLADAAPPAGSIPTTPPLPTSAPVAPPNDSGGSAIWSTSLSELVLMLVILCLCR